MSESKHTPSPWNIEPFDPWDKQIMVNEPAVAVDYDDVDRDTQEANARLIAAAPDLLAVVHTLLATAYGDHDGCALYIQARAAIAKAEGAE
jgi:hypothetical protein